MRSAEQRSIPPAGRLLLVLLLQASVSCNEGTGAFGIRQVAISANPDNVLSAVMYASTSRVSRARVNYAATGHRARSTPDYDASYGIVSLPVLGLMPNTDYDMWMTVFGDDGTTLDGPRVPFTTGDLSLNLPKFQITQSGVVEPGYTMLAWISSDAAAPGTPIIVDRRGRVVWYHQFDTSITDWQKQPDGTYTAAVNEAPKPPPLDSRTVYYQLESTGAVLQLWRVAEPWWTDNHELRLLPNGEALLLATNWRTMDLSPWGGPTDGKVYGNLLQRLNSSGALSFSWDFFDHLSVTATDPLILRQLTPDSELDFTHANAIDITADGNYLVSMRNVSQVIKIDPHTGDLVWKLGGTDGHFTFEGDPLGGFFLQHAARELPNGNILLFDNGNGHRPPQSRAVEYQLDLDRRTATLVWQFNPQPHLFGAFMGFTQRLSNGNTLITYGALPVVQEVNPSGQVVWELRAPRGSGFIYRATRIASLY